MLQGNLGDLFCRWRKGRNKKLLNELCEITKNKLSYLGLKEVQGYQITECGIEQLKKENKLLKKVLREEWAKKQFEQQLNELRGTELVNLLDDGFALKIFNMEEPKLQIVKLQFPDLGIIGQGNWQPKTVSDKEIELAESGRLYLCDYWGITQLKDCALKDLYKKLVEKIDERASRGELKAVERKLNARGIKLLFFVTPEIPEKKQPDLSNLLVDNLPWFFSGVHIDYDKHILLGEKTSLTTTVIEVHCPQAKFRLRPSEAGEFYGKLYDKYLAFAHKILAENNFNLMCVRFDLVFRIAPPEEPNEFIPLDIDLPPSRTENKLGLKGHWDM